MYYRLCKEMSRDEGVLNCYKLLLAARHVSLADVEQKFLFHIFPQMNTEHGDPVAC